MLTEPKFKRPAKTGDEWPGIVKLNFTHPGIQYPWKYYCPQPLCFYHIVAATREKLVEWIEAHTCPWFGGGTTTFSWGTMSDNFLQPIWQLLDEQMKIVYDESKGSSERLAAREQSRGLAYALSILMPPFFTTAGEIIIEAKVRREKREAGEDYETPGLGRFKFQRPPGMTTEPDDPSWITKPEYVADETKPRPKPKPQPAAAQKGDIVVEVNKVPGDKQAEILARKGFPVRMLAAAYGISEDVIRYIQGAGATS